MMNALYARYFRMDSLSSLGLLFFRLTMGSAFVLHGMPKIQNAFTWMGDAPIPGILQAAAAFAEFGGGIALVLGLFTPLVSLALIGTMIGALGLVHLPMGHDFVSSTGDPSYELALVYLTGALLFLLAGPGRFSADALFFGRLGNE